MTRKLIVSLLLLFGSAAAALPASTAAPLPDENGTAPPSNRPGSRDANTRSYGATGRSSRPGNWPKCSKPRSKMSVRWPNRWAFLRNGRSNPNGTPRGIYHRIAAELAPAAIRPTAHAARHHARGTGMAADRRRLPVRKTGLQETLLPAAALRKAFRTGRTTSRPGIAAQVRDIRPATGRCRDAPVRIHRRIFPKS